jgi:transposase-like protein
MGEKDFHSMATVAANSKFAELFARNGHSNHQTQTFSGNEEEPEATTTSQKSDAEHVAPTVRAKASRKRYSNEEKRRILRLVDACSERGQIAAILRREGIYYATLRLFMQQRDKGLLDMPATAANKARDPEKEMLQKQVEQLTQQNLRLADSLQKAQLVIDFQKKLSQLLQSLETNPS